MKKNNDRYEFILPKLDITKKIDNFTNLAGNFLLKSSNLIRSYDTNILEKVNINNFIFNSDPLFTKSGFKNNFDLIIKNINSDTKNSSSYKQDENFYLSGLFQYNSSFPMVKKNNEFSKYFKTKISIKNKSKLHKRFK